MLDSSRNQFTFVVNDKSLSKQEIVTFYMIWVLFYIAIDQNKIRVLCVWEVPKTIFEVLG